MGQVIISPEAEADLLEIWDYIAQSNEVAADRLLDSIDQKLTLLSDSPYVGKERDDLSIELRSFPIKNYVIFYRPVDGGIEVVRVLHGARDIENLI